jgi:hypothetical protein
VAWNKNIPAGEPHCDSTADERFRLAQLAAPRFTQMPFDCPDASNRSPVDGFLGRARQAGGFFQTAYAYEIGFFGGRFGRNMNLYNCLHARRYCVFMQDMHGR